MEPTGERGFDARGCRDNPPWLSFCRMVTIRTGTEAPDRRRGLSATKPARLLCCTFSTTLSSVAFARICRRGRRGGRAYPERFACDAISTRWGVRLRFPQGGRAHLPAAAVAGAGERAGMMAEPVASSRDMEFLKNSINTRGYSVNQVHPLVSIGHISI